MEKLYDALRRIYEILYANTIPDSEKIKIIKNIFRELEEE